MTFLLLPVGFAYMYKASPLTHAWHTLVESMFEQHACIAQVTLQPSYVPHSTARFSTVMTTCLLGQVYLAGYRTFKEYC